MHMDRSRIPAYLSYRNAPGALAWMSQIGFEILARQDDEHGGIAHAEVKYGNAVLMVASADAKYDTPQLNSQSVGGGLYLCPPHGERCAWLALARRRGRRSNRLSARGNGMGVPAEHVSSTLRFTSGASERIDLGAPGGSCCDFRTCLFGT